jgi:uncharacterized protein (UPF0335 family)
LANPHTSDGQPRPNSETATVAAAQLRSLIERVERLEGEKKDLAQDIKEVYVEAKGVGYDTKIMRKIVRLRAQDKAKRDEERAMTELYLEALGML